MKITKSQLKEIIREVIKESSNESLNEGEFVFHYGEGQNRIVHQLKSFRLEDALKKFIDMYKIPENKWNKILVSKNKWF